MFNGISDPSFHQFIASSSSSSSSSISSSSRAPSIHHNHQHPSSLSFVHGCPPPPSFLSNPFLETFHHPSSQFHQSILLSHHLNPPPVPVSQQQRELHCQIQSPATTTTTTDRTGNKAEKEKQVLSRTNTELYGRHSTTIQQQQQQQQQQSIIDPSSWTNEEVLALLRLRSSLENWFPDFSWEHVSRKLGELGFKRSAVKCKEKFDEESRLLDSSINFNKINYRCFSELEELYNGDNSRMSAHDEKNQSTENPPSHEEEEEEEKIEEHNLEDEEREEKESSEDEEMINITKSMRSTSKKRKRKLQKLEMFKSFCVDIVNKMMNQQEELHKKLLEDMLKRDEDRIAREEAWKRQETERINKDFENRTREHMIASDRQTTIIEFLRKFTSNSDGIQAMKMPKPNSGSSSMTSSPSLIGSSTTTFNTTKQLTVKNKVEAVPTSSSTIIDAINCLNKNPENSTVLAPQILPNSNPNANLVTEVPTPSTPGLPLQNPNSTHINNKNNSFTNTVQSSSQKLAGENSQGEMISVERGDNNTGRRWPRNEVLALINLRCSLNNKINDDHQQQEAGIEGNNNNSNIKVPLWERISQGMLELGYKRSAKRCKEKWENINKYFRKTKDVNKKRSLNSRTCPYFHQLSCLYTQGTLVSQACSSLLENCPESPSKPPGSSPENS